MNEKEELEIAKFLLKDTESLRNEKNFTDINELVHPLIFSYDLKKHANMNLIPVLDKSNNEKVKKRFFDLIE